MVHVVHIGSAVVILLVFVLNLYRRGFDFGIVALHLIRRTDLYNGVDQGIIIVVIIRFIVAALSKLVKRLVKVLILNLEYQRDFLKPEREHL